MPPSIPPTFAIKNDSGTLRVWRGVLKGMCGTEELRKAIPFRENYSHGHTDRKKWEQKRKEDESPAILKSIEERATKVVGHELASWNYANYYEDGSNHTFTHRDFNCNPNEFVTLVSFGAERMLAFCDCQKAKIRKKEADRSDGYLVIPLSDGSILQFDGSWNMLHYHKVLKFADANGTLLPVGPRVSIQWYERRDSSKWTQEETDIWETHGSSKNHVKYLKQRMKKDLESCVLERVYRYIPPELRGPEDGRSIEEPRPKRRRLEG